MTGRKHKLNEISFEKVSDFFRAECRNGKNPSVNAYAAAFPHLALEIQAEFPALVLLEKTAGFQVPPAPKKTKSSSKSLGGCEIEDEIGRGGMGVVYRGYQRELDRKVAVKVLHLHQNTSESILGRFELERRAMARLEHPNIVPIYECGVKDQQAYLVMKYIEGRSLYQLLVGQGDYRDKVLLSDLQTNWKSLAKLGADVASGLDHAHEQGLIHRDIKPANLLLDNRGKIWITDFGLAKVYDYARSLSLTGDAIGTPRYMAPEQLRGKCDPRSDIYSLGITLYELAAGERVWSDQTLSTLTARRASIELEDIRIKNPNVPENFARIIMKACAYAPEDRYQTVKELEIVLQRFIHGIHPSDRRRKRREPNQLFFRKSKRNAIIAIGIMPFAVCALTYLLQGFVFSKKAESQPVVLISAEPPIKKSTSNFLEKLAEPRNEDLGKVLTQFVKEAVDESSEELHLANNEKEAIAEQVDTVVSKIRETRNTDESAMRSFLDAYRDSTLPTGTKIISVSRIVERSTMKDQEKAIAYQILRRFARAVVNRMIPENEALQMLASLTNGRLFKSDELVQLRIPDNNLRTWLSMLNNRMTILPPQVDSQLNIQQEIDAALTRRK